MVRQIYAVGPREILDKVALGGAFLLGCVGSVVLKFSEAPVLATALWPVGVLVGYVLACLALRRIAIEPETVGDNCYYLGFLFTLSSLAVTLYQIRNLSSLDGGATLAADVIPLVISGFGVALMSTIMGVFLRVMMMQMRPDIVARDREIRRDLSQGARDFQVSVAQATSRIKQASVESVQHAAERNARMDEITNRHAKDTAALLERQTKSMEVAIEATAKRLADEVVTRLALEAQAAAEGLKLASMRLAASIAETAAVQEETGPALREAHKDLRSALQLWRSAAEAQASAVAASGQGFAEQSASLAATVESHRHATSQSVQTLQGSTDALARAVDVSIASIERASRRLEDAQHSREEVSPAVPVATGGLRFLNGWAGRRDADGAV